MYLDNFLERFDIAYATSVMSGFNMSSRKGHLKAVKKILAYVKTFPKARFIIDTRYSDHSVYPVEDHQNLVIFYPDGVLQSPLHINCNLG
jgi:hypothetical protein